MDRPWLYSYPEGVPAAIDLHRYASLNDLLERSCATYAKHTAFACLGAELSYADVERLSRHFASFLQHTLSLARGERVAIMLPNTLQYPIALFGVLRAGLVAVNVNPLYTAAELSAQLTDSGATTIVVLENFAHTVEAALPSTGLRHVIITRIGDLMPFPRRFVVNAAVKYFKRTVPRWHIGHVWQFHSALHRGRRKNLLERSIRPQDTALLQYTGGTTGRPKGAMLTHRNLIANVEQVAAWGSTVLSAGAETVVTALPLYHIFALTANLLVFIKLGGRNVLIPDARDMGALVRELARTRFTCITGVNTLFKALLDAPGFVAAIAANAGALKLAVAGGMAVERTVAARWQDMTNVPLIEGYGLTEASPIVCANRFNASSFSGNLGLAVPSTDIAIVDDQERQVKYGEVGEICVRGPQVMSGYWNAPEETREAFTRDGWLKTGDMGYMDEHGHVAFTERKKDVIVVSGFKAYPTEIEEVALKHPGVKDAAAVGMHDERTGEA
ncbi:MAG: AMP-binding protein, partial [Burkholderiales bacterium]